MATIGLIFWCMTICICLCNLFKLPKFISKHFNNYRFPGYSRNFTALDNDFVRRHVELIQNHRATFKNPPQKFIMKASVFLLLYFGIWVPIFMVITFGGNYVIWLTDIIGNRPTDSSYLIHPFGGYFTLVLGMCSNIILVQAIQFWVVKGDKEQVALRVFGSQESSPKNTPEILNKRTADALELLIREGILDSDKSYTINEFIEIGGKMLHKYFIKMVLASAILFFSVFSMSVFKFLKISNNQIIYSPAYSFKVTVKNFDDVTTAKYICVSNGAGRHMKLLVELDNGYEFRVWKNKDIDGILRMSNITLNDRDDAIESCKNKK